MELDYMDPPILQLHPLAIYPFSTWSFSKLPRKNRKKTSATKTHAKDTYIIFNTFFLGGRVWWHIFPKEKKWFSESSDLLDSLKPNEKKWKCAPQRPGCLFGPPHWNSWAQLQNFSSPICKKRVKIRICQNISTLARNWILRWRKGLGAKFGWNNGEFHGRFNRKMLP